MNKKASSDDDEDKEEDDDDEVAPGTEDLVASGEDESQLLIMSEVNFETLHTSICI